MSQTKVQDNKHMLIDTKSRAVVNTNTKEYHAAKQRIEIQKKQSKSLERLDQLENEVKSMKNDLQTILTAIEAIATRV